MRVELQVIDLKGFVICVFDPLTVSALRKGQV